MNTPKWSNIRLILSREIRDQLRDRRTLFMIAILPLLLYPLLGMSFLQVAQFLKKHPSRVLLVTEVPLPGDPPLLRDGQLVGLAPAEQKLLDVDVQLAELPLGDQAARQAAAIIDQGRYDLVVCFSEEFWQQLPATWEKSGPPVAEAGDDGDSTPAEPQLFFNAAKDKSRIAYDRMTAVLRHWRARIVNRTLVKHQLSARATMPFELAAKDIARPVVRRAALWSKVLPFVMIVWSLTGAFYPAVDLCAGEKERGTLETLLSSPAERTEIVWGKLLTIMAFSMTTAVLNLLCMVFTATFILGQVQLMLGAESLQVVGPPPLSALGWLLLALVPISALFSALSLALATMARSTKEGQYYLMPLLLATMPLMMLPMLPSAELDLGSSIVPVTGVLLLLRQLMEGEYREVLIYALPVIATTTCCCLMALRWAVDQFNNESVLFRESERLDLGLWLRHVVRDRGPTPSVFEAALCGVLILMIRFFAGLALPLPESWSSFVIVTVITLIAFIATPALLMTVMLTTQPRMTLLLKKPPAWTLPAAAALAVCMHPLALAATAVISMLYPLDEAALAPLGTLVSQAPNMTVVLLLLAVLPAICEELAFRGFILSGLRHVGNKWRAIFVSSLLFGLAHGVLQQSITATLFGMVIGYLAVQTGSLFPCIVFHVIHNGLAIVMGSWIPTALERQPQLEFLFQQLPSGNGGTPIFIYAPVVVLPACVLCLWILTWFRDLPYQQSAEERLSEAMEHAPLPVATS